MHKCASNLSATAGAVGQALRNTSSVEEHIPFLSREVVARPTLAEHPLGAGEDVLLAHAVLSSLRPAETALIIALAEADGARLAAHIQVGLERVEELFAEVAIIGMATRTFYGVGTATGIARAHFITRDGAGVGVPRESSVGVILDLDYFEPIWGAAVDCGGLALCQKSGNGGEDCSLGDEHDWIRMGTEVPRVVLDFKF